MKNTSKNQRFQEVKVTNITKFSLISPVDTVLHSTFRLAIHYSPTT